MLQNVNDVGRVGSATGKCTQMRDSLEAQRLASLLISCIVIELSHPLAKRNQTVSEALEWLVSRGYESAFITDNENFILRRDTTTSTASCSRSFQLTFDSRPLFLHAQHAKGKPLTGIFELI